MLTGEESVECFVLLIIDLPRAGAVKLFILLSGQSPPKQIRFTGTEILQRKAEEMTFYD